jgi:hypothetical protein
MQKIFLTAIVFLLIGSFLAYADIPHLITYQGRLTDNAGVPVTDGSYDLTFKIYDDSTSGTILWTEVQSITTESGLFNVQLGSITSLVDSIFAMSPDLFMGLQLVGSATEMSPRSRLTSSAFSFRASHADTADYAHAAPSGAGGWVDNGNKVILTDSTNMVGIGTSNPLVELDVRGHAYIEESAHIGEGLSIGDVFQFNPNTDLFRSVSGYMDFDNTALLLDNRMAIGNFGSSNCRLWIETEGTIDTIGLRVYNSTGTAASFTSGTTGYPSNSNAVAGFAGGSSIAGWFSSSGDGHGVVARTEGIGDAVHSTATGTGYSGFFEGGAGVMVSGDMEVTGALKLPDGAANGYVLTSDASGVSSWQSSASGSPWTASAGKVYLNDSTDMVGIGTSNPSTNLEVEGDILITGKATIGIANINSTPYGFVAGASNKATGQYASVSGGIANTAGSNYAHIGGGYDNLANNWSSTVGGGEADTVLGVGATIAGGVENYSSSDYSFIGGGQANHAMGLTSTIGGGKNNYTHGDYSVVAGGGGPDPSDSNSAAGDYSTISGGYSNTAEGESSTIGGGCNNETSDFSHSTIGGGEYNDALGGHSTVAGGYSNEASSNYSFVGGGNSNNASGSTSAVCGGGINEARGSYSIVGSGTRNVASGSHSVVSGGGGLSFPDSNYAAGICATVPGGRSNGAVGNFSFAAGQRAKANHNGAFVWSDRTGTDFASTASDQFLVRASGGVGIGNNAPAAALDVAGDIIVVGSTSGRLVNFTNNVVSSSPGHMVNLESEGDLGMNNDLLQIVVGATSSSNSQFIECERGTDIEFRVWGDGDVTADGAITGGGADFAEMVSVSDGINTVEPGDVLVIDPSSNCSLSKSGTARSTLVAGVYSTSPGFIASEHDWDQLELERIGAAELSDEMPSLSIEELAEELGEVPLAVVGIVPCKVTAENGAISPGDLLVSASLPGYAMIDNNPKVGTVIGKALEPLSTGTGVIKILLTLQ